MFAQIARVRRAGVCGARRHVPCGAHAAAIAIQRRRAGGPRVRLPRHPGAGAQGLRHIQGYTLLFLLL